MTDTTQWFDAVPDPKTGTWNAQPRPINPNKLSKDELSGIIQDTLETLSNNTDSPDELLKLVLLELSMVYPADEFLIKVQGRDDYLKCTLNFGPLEMQNADGTWSVCTE